MKIDAYRLSQAADTAALPRTADAGKGSARESAAPPGTGDQVRLSPDAQLLSAAIREAGQPAGIRTDVVERMRAKLAAGEVGTDAGRLADRIIDGLLEG